jgi:hypothetical protein
MVNRMPTQKQFREAELQLAEALTDADRKNGLINHSRDCLSAEQLRQLAAGKSSQSDAILVHLGDCLTCTQLLSRLRGRTARIRRLSLALATAIVVLVAVLLISIRPSHLPIGIATIDLRLASPTRGAGNAEGVVHAARSNGTVRILLPIGSEGKYESEIQSKPGGRSIVSSSGQASLQNREIILDLPINLAQVPSGSYYLALRRNSSEWIYYSLDLK